MGFQLLPLEEESVGGWTRFSPTHRHTHARTRKHVSDSWGSGGGLGLWHTRVRICVFGPR